MQETPNPLNRRSMTRAGIAGIVLATLGVVLFIVLWVTLGSAGISQLARLLLSLCLPPAIIAALIGIYVLVARTRQ